MIRKLAIGIGLLLVIAIISAQLFFEYGLSDTLRNTVIPSLQNQLGAEVAVDHIRVNLLGGSVAAYGIKIMNPEGFDLGTAMTSIERCSIKIGWVALLGGQVADIKKVRIKGAQVDIVRNRDGRMNIEPILELFRKLSGERSRSGVGAAGAVPAQPGRHFAAWTMPRAWALRDMEVRTHIRYVDHTFNGEPLALALDVNLKARDIANQGASDVLSGTVELQGNLMADEKPSAFDLRGRVSPLMDMARWSFDLSGSMQTVDLKSFRRLAETNGIEDGAVAMTVGLVSRKGIYDTDKSALRLTCQNLKLADNRRVKLKNIKLPPTVQLVVPVEGSISNPKVDVMQAITRTVMSEGVFDAIIKGILSAQGRTNEAETVGNPAASLTPDVGGTSAAPKRPASSSNFDKLMNDFGNGRNKP